MRAIIFALFLGITVLCGCKIGKTCDARGDSPDVCEIHHLYMRGEKFPNPHRTTPPSREYLQARMQYFKHSKPTLYMLPDDCKSCMVYICDDCVEAERQWKLAHPGVAP